MIDMWALVPMMIRSQGEVMPAKATEGQPG